MFGEQVDLWFTVDVFTSPDFYVNKKILASGSTTQLFLSISKNL
jgi:hypothetical protein